MHRHLVTVEVGVEGRTDQRMELDGPTFDQDRFKGLDTQAVKCRRPVEQDRMVLDDLVQHVPDDVAASFHLPAGRLDVLGIAITHDFPHDEGLEELQGHLLGQTALVEFQLRADHDNGAA